MRKITCRDEASMHLHELQVIFRKRATNYRALLHKASMHLRHPVPDKRTDLDLNLYYVLILESWVV